MRNAGDSAGGNDRSLSDAAQEKRWPGVTGGRDQQMESGAQGVDMPVSLESGDGDWVTPPGITRRLSLPPRERGDVTSREYRTVFILGEEKTRLYAHVVEPD